MRSNHYRFLTYWYVRGRAGDVYDTIRDVKGYCIWWPEVYLKVETIGDGYALLTKGRLPYRLRWHARTVDAERPHRLVVEARGDLEGRGEWTFKQDGEYVEIRFDWRVRADKPVIRYLSFLFKPLFAANHRWAMKRGETGLRRYLDRWYTHKS